MTSTAEQMHLSVQNLNKTYPRTEVPAVSDINLDVQQGDLVALLGPSGCGKTTTLRMIAGLLEPSAGSIRVKGKEVTSTPVHKRGMGMVFQSYALFPHMSVLDNVSFGLEMRGGGRRGNRKAAKAALDMVQLGHLAERRPAALSGGQQQRIALARALAIEPTLLLLDEPLSNLDAKLREAMRHEIRSIQQRSGTTTLLVTHDQDEALDMADKIAIMENGIIQQYDAPQEIYEHPTNKFVANFVGKANFIPSTSVRQVGEGRYSIEAGAFGDLTVPGVVGIKGDRAELVLRPHRVRLMADGEVAADRPRARGQIIASSYTGNVVSYEMQSSDNDRVIRIDQLSHPADRLPVGAEITVSFDPEDAYLVAEG
ncbi:ABC transporter ATP-binding protein [Agrococcus casei]|nr:ABC transporter ATP-binding protein [Agrococcus casei]